MPVRDYVFRLYRAFMGRFPGEGEVDFWSGEIVHGRQTLDEVVEYFSNSDEFTGIMERHGMIETASGGAE